MLFDKLKNINETQQTAAEGQSAQPLVEDAPGAGSPDPSSPAGIVRFTLNEQNECVADCQGKMVLQLYDRTTGQFCLEHCLYTETNIITAEVLKELFREVDPEQAEPYLRIVVSSDNGSSFQWLQMDHYERRERSKIIHFVPRRHYMADALSICIYLSKSGYLSASTTDLMVSFQNAALQVDLSAFKDALRISVPELGIPEITQTWFGFYDKTAKRYYLYEEAKRVISIKDISLLYRAIRPKLKSSELSFCLFVSGEASEIRPLSIKPISEYGAFHLYDALLLAARKPDKDQEIALLYADRKGRLCVKKIQAEEKDKYHTITEADTMPEGLDQEYFDMIETRAYDNHPDTFFRIARYYLEFLKEKPALLQADLYWVKKRILNNLSAMILSAREMKSVFKKDEISYEQQWQDFKTLLTYIEDDLIYNALFPKYCKLFLLGIKYDQNYTAEEYISDTQIKYGDDTSYKISELIMKMELFEVKEDCLVIEGSCSLPEAVKKQEPSLAVYVNDRLYTHTEINRCENRYVFQKLYSDVLGFRLEIPLYEEKEFTIAFGLRIRGFVNMFKALSYGTMAPIGTELKNGYYYKNGYKLTAAKDRIVCKQSSEKDRAKSEVKLQREIEKRFPENAAFIIGLRNYYFAHADRKRGQQWLLIDRPDRADDNAEALFKYLSASPIEQVKPVFIVNQEAESFTRLQQYGTVLAFRSEEHLKAFLTSDCVISSHMSPSTMNPFNEDWICFRDMMRERNYIFLQHGLTANDNGKAFSHYVRNFTGVITSAERERDYLLMPHMNNDPDTIWLTGMPRFDFLKDKSQKIITIMPTWRQFLTKWYFDEEQQTKTWHVVDNFTESEYFQFYNSLINHPGLIRAAREHGYRITFMLHPQFLKTGSLFSNEHPDVLHICDYEKSYQEVYAESSLIMTDYTSAVFDFAYLKKPIAYCQFDKEKFFEGHTVKTGYFDFEKDGLGEVVYNLDDAVQLLIGYIQTDCRLKDEYRERIEKFFAFSDRNCCSRVCRQILEHTKTPEPANRAGE